MDFDRDQSAGYLTNWAARLLTRAIERELKPLRLSSGHLPIYFALAGGKARTQKQLAEHAGVEQPTMAATLARMERDGLIVRKADPKDRRSSLISLSRLAEEKSTEVLAAVNTINGAALANLDADERAQFLTTLRTINSSLTKLLDE